MNVIRKMKTAVLSVVALVLGMTATVQAGLINTSPIDTWEGAGAVHNNAGGGGTLHGDEQAVLDRPWCVVFPSGKLTCIGCIW